MKYNNKIQIANISFNYFSILAFCLSILLMASCSSTRNLKSVSCTYDENQASRPGSQVGFFVHLRYKNGRKRTLHGKYMQSKRFSKNYMLHVDGGKVDGNHINISAYDDSAMHKEVTCTVQVIDKPALTDTIRFNLNYKGETRWSGRGYSGEVAKTKGQRIIPLKIFGSGSSGKDAENGSSGGDAKGFVLYVYKVHNDSFYNIHGYDCYTVATLQDDHTLTYTFVAEQDAQLTIEAIGGDGGNGGGGGPGVEGKSENKRGRVGSGSDGGNGGNGGDGGNGGNVIVYLDSSASDFPKILHVMNQGGKGGSGGAGGAAGEGGLYNDGKRGDAGNKGANGSNGGNGHSGTLEIIHKNLLN
jgi:hypothetical protein